MRAEDVRPARNLPSESEPWARSIDGDIRDIKRQLTRLKGDTRGVRQVVAKAADNADAKASENLHQVGEAKDAAQDAQGKAEDAQGKAEEAEGKAETAQDIAQDAQNAADQAKEDAGTAIANAATASQKADKAAADAREAWGRVANRAVNWSFENGATGWVSNFSVNDSHSVASPTAYDGERVLRVSPSNQVRHEIRQSDQLRVEAGRIWETVVRARVVSGSAVLGSGFYGTDPLQYHHDNAGTFTPADGWVTLRSTIDTDKVTNTYLSPLATVTGPGATIEWDAIEYKDITEALNAQATADAAVLEAEEAFKEAKAAREVADNAQAIASESWKNAESKVPNWSFEEGDVPWMSNYGLSASNIITVPDAYDGSKVLRIGLGTTVIHHTYLPDALMQEATAGDTWEVSIRFRVTGSEAARGCVGVRLVNESGGWNQSYDLTSLDPSAEWTKLTYQYTVTPGQWVKIGPYFGGQRTNTTGQVQIDGVTFTNISALERARKALEYANEAQDLAQESIEYARERVRARGNLVVNGDFEMGDYGWPVMSGVEVVEAGARKGSLALELEPGGVLTKYEWAGVPHESESIELKFIDGDWVETRRNLVVNPTPVGEFGWTSVGSATVQEVSDGGIPAMEVRMTDPTAVNGYTRIQDVPAPSNGFVAISADVKALDDFSAENFRFVLQGVLGNSTPTTIRAVPVTQTEYTRITAVFPVQGGGVVRPYLWPLNTTIARVGFRSRDVHIAFATSQSAALEQVAEYFDGDSTPKGPHIESEWLSTAPGRNYRASFWAKKPAPFVNHILNPSFETNLAYWALSGTGKDLERITSYSGQMWKQHFGSSSNHTGRFGSFIAQARATGTSGDYYYLPNTENRSPIKPGQWVGAYAQLATENSMESDLRIQFLNAAGTTIGYSEQEFHSSGFYPGYIARRVAQAPPGAVTVRVIPWTRRIDRTTLPDGARFWLEAVQAVVTETEEEAQLSTIGYFDGDQPNAGWLDTRHGSPSVQDFRDTNLYISYRLMDSSGHISEHVSIPTPLSEVGHEEWTQVDVVVELPSDRDITNISFGFIQDPGGPATLVNDFVVTDITESSIIGQDAILRIDEAKAEVIQEFTSDIAQTSDQILSTVELEYTSKSDLVEELGFIQSQIDQTAEWVDIRFTEASEAVIELAGDLQGYQSEVATYIRFSSAGIELGKAGSPFIARLSETELAFLQNGQRVAYISNNKLHITDAEIKNNLALGTPETGYFDFIPRTNGNLSFQYREGDA